MAERKKKPRALTIAELERINHATANGVRSVAREMAKLAILATDARAAERRVRQNCGACEYLSRYTIAGHGFTDWKCQVCATPQPAHPNTAVPRVCPGCAVVYGLCASCGGDMELQHRGRMSGRLARRVIA
jgi:hypothetical protein